MNTEATEITGFNEEGYQLLQCLNMEQAAPARLALHTSEACKLAGQAIAFASDDLTGGCAPVAQRIATMIIALDALFIICPALKEGVADNLVREVDSLASRLLEMKGA